MLNEGGRLGYITSNGFMWNEAGEPLRRLLAQSRSVRELIDLGVARVFKDAGPATAILILDRSPKRVFRHARLYQRDVDDDSLLSELPALHHQSFALRELGEDLLAFPAKSD